MTYSDFDSYANQYEQALQKGLQFSGESSDYFANKRVSWLGRRLSTKCSNSGALEGGAISTVMDFGCGTGNSIPYLMHTFQPESIIGLDTSTESLKRAKSRFPDERLVVDEPIDYRPSGNVDLVYCNGVFHHIPIENRGSVVRLIYDALRRGGWFAFWENNPWNPGTRYVMSRIPFDRDAETLSIIQARRLLTSGGFQIESVDSCFYFPRFLSAFRFTEPMLCKIPLGAQYLILARKPA